MISGTPVPPPKIQTFTAATATAADPDEAVRRGWATRWGDLLSLVNGCDPKPTTPVIIIRQGGGVWVIDSVRLASDGAIEITVRPS